MSFVLNNDNHFVVPQAWRLDLFKYFGQIANLIVEIDIHLKSWEQSEKYLLMEYFIFYKIFNKDFYAIITFQIIITNFLQITHLCINLMDFTIAMKIVDFLSFGLVSRDSILSRLVSQSYTNLESRLVSSRLAFIIGNLMLLS